MLSDTEKIAKEIAEKQAGVNPSRQDLKDISASFKKAGGLEEGLIHGSMDSFSQLKDVIIKHVTKNSNAVGSLSGLMIYAGTLQAHRKVLYKKIAVGNGGFSGVVVFSDKKKAGRFCKEAYSKYVSWTEQSSEDYDFRGPIEVTFDAWPTVSRDEIEQIARKIDPGAKITWS